MSNKMALYLKAWISPNLFAPRYSIATRSARAALARSCARKENDAFRIDLSNSQAL